MGMLEGEAAGERVPGSMHRAPVALITQSLGPGGLTLHRQGCGKGDPIGRAPSAMPHSRHHTNRAQLSPWGSERLLPLRSTEQWPHRWLSSWLSEDQLGNTGQLIHSMGRTQGGPRLLPQQHGTASQHCQDPRDLQASCPRLRQNTLKPTAMPPPLRPPNIHTPETGPAWGVTPFPSDLRAP